MTSLHRRRWRPRLMAPLLAATLGLALGLTSAPALAENEPPAEEPAPGEGSGRSGDGYIATGCLAGLAMFLVAKTARRQVAR